ncbi:AAA family ATPase [Deinococcus roseus]|uniref:ORC1/DEAH AAA+ ATPase domain-containing protein n=1 Tax=Deinococcus roseus TaxID=392414 RepID=A0ABQ2D5I6_9DEIO|nr:AAA family ATPase [Deinococcus roseus]GGJ44159.1 hypothetical protein GCM10008938_33040 [Deinococcus roseus]
MLIPPALPEEVSRTHLLQMIAQSSARLVVLSAPTGYGKTTLLAAWARMHPQSTLWVTVHPDGHTDHTLFEELRVQLPALQNTSLLDIKPSTVAQVLRQVSTPTFIICDQGWTFKTSALKFLVELVSLLAPQHKILLASHHTHIDGLQQLAFTRDLLVLGPQQMAFTLQECQELLPGFTEEDRRYTQGWCSLIMQETGMGFYIDPMEVITDMMQGVQDQTRHQLFLHRHLAPWNFHEHKSWLQELLQKGLPILPTVRRTYQLHPLMDQWVEKHLSEISIEPPSRSNDHTQVLVYLKALQEQNLHHKVIQYCEQQLRSWYAEENYDLIRTVISEIPPERLTPKLHTALAEAYIETGRAGESKPILQNLQNAGVATSRTYLLLARQANRNNQFNELRHMAEKAISLAEDGYDRTLARLLMTSYWIRRDEHETALKLARECLAEAKILGHTDLIVIALARLSYTTRYSGNLVEAIHSAREAIRYATEAGIPKRISQVVNNLADMLKDQGEYQEAIDHIGNAILLFPEQASNTVVPYLMVTRGLILAELRQYESAVENFLNASKRFRAAHHFASFLMPYTYMIFCLYKLGWIEKLNEMYDQLQEAWQTGRPDDPQYTEPESYLPVAKGIYLYANGRTQEALEALKLLRYEKAYWYDSVLIGHLFLCKVKHELSQVTQEDAKMLDTILQRREGNAAFTAYADGFLEVLKHFMVQGWCSDLVRQELMTRVNTRSPVVYSIRISSMGSRLAQMTINGTVIPMSTQSPVLALIYLKFHQGQWITSERMGADLWEGFKNPKNNVFNAMSELRRLLSESDPLLEGLLSPPRHPQGYLLTDLYPVDLDVMEYLYLENLTPDRQEELLGQYPGEFLPAVSNSWVHTIRQKVVSQLSDLALRKAGQAGSTFHGLIYLLKGLKADPHHFEMATQALGLASALGVVELAEKLNSFMRWQHDDSGKEVPLHLLSID